MSLGTKIFRKKDKYKSLRAPRSHFPQRKPELLRKSRQLQVAVKKLQEGLEKWFRG